MAEPRMFSATTTRIQMSFLACLLDQKEMKLTRSRNWKDGTEARLAFIISNLWDFSVCVFKCSSLKRTMLINRKVLKYQPTCHFLLSYRKPRWYNKSEKNREQEKKKGKKKDKCVKVEYFSISTPAHTFFFSLLVSYSKAKCFKSRICCVRHPITVF